ncbi:unnamed protein product [Rhizoctonia solani]|uniref:Uncharacterized protein n=1 Tax=Rhizoctonia solani TaxID=456999 RepID=A0A8H2X7N3_9AGAM|nr:unnamed protein product [Rhizoctonia solani]
MFWLRKKKPTSEDGDFPPVSKYYREHEGKPLTKPVNVAPSLQWTGGVTVVWGIDVGPVVSTVSFAYLSKDVEVHNIIYWPEAFPVRECDSSRKTLPEVNWKKGFKLQETIGSVGFVSHRAWSPERVFNYVHVTGGSATSPLAFQVRTELPFIEVTNERHKYVDLAEHLLKHALSVYGAVIKPGQARWSRASDVVVSLPSGISKSARMSVVDGLGRMIKRVMPKVIGLTQVYYVSKPDLRPFEDDTWRNLDTDLQASVSVIRDLCAAHLLQHNEKLMTVDWDLKTGDTICASYKVRRLPNRKTTFETRQRSYLQSAPVIQRRESITDEQEGTQFANALYWVAEHKHNTRKLMVRISNAFRKSEGLLRMFHKVLTELGLQVGIRLVDSMTETGAFSAVMWRVAQVVAPKDLSGEYTQPAQDAATAPNMEDALGYASDSELGRLKIPRIAASFYSERGVASDGQMPTTSPPVSFRPPNRRQSWSPHRKLPSTPVNRHSLSSSQVEVTKTSVTIQTPTTKSFPLEDEATNSSTPPPAYTADNGNAA